MRTSCCIICPHSESSYFSPETVDLAVYICFGHPAWKSINADPGFCIKINIKHVFFFSVTISYEASTAMQSSQIKDLLECLSWDLFFFSRHSSQR